MSKHFTLAEAEQLVRRVEPLLRSAIELKPAYAQAEGELNEFRARAARMGGVLLDREQVTDARGRRDAAAGRLRAVIEEIVETGCLVKDLDTGLIDFPTLFRGTEVYLCWRMGETAIAFWHGVDEGFRGRKAIDQDFRDHHKGDPPQ
jgi:hypothetical protein